MRKIMLISSLLLSTIAQADVSSVHDFSQLQQQEALAQAELSIKQVQAKIAAENAKISNPANAHISVTTMGAIGKTDEQGSRLVLKSLTGTGEHYSGVISLNGNAYRVREGATVGSWRVTSINAQGIALANDHTHCQVVLHTNGTSTRESKGDRHV